MSALQVIDTHFHIWDPEVQNLPWLADTNGKITRKYTIADLAAKYEQYSDVEFVGGVYVEVDQENPEQEDALLEANKDPRILARMLRAKVGPAMRVPLNAQGVREPLHTGDSPRGRCLEPEFIAGLRALAEHGLVFEVTNRGAEIGDIAKAFAQVPELTMILDHLGNVTELDSDTRKALEEIARLPHAYVKVSGDNPVNPDIVKFVKDTFGPHKVLFASNFPVVTMNGTFEAHFELMRSLFADCPDFFAGNARKAYGLPA